MDLRPIHLAGVSSLGPLLSVGRSGGGRVGEPRDPSVYSVGLGGCQPAASRWRRRGRSGVLGRRSISSSVRFHGASSATVRPFLACRSAELRCELPLAGGRVAAAPVMSNPKKLFLLKLVVGDGVAGWRLSGAEERQLTVRRGVPPDPRPKGRKSGGALSAASSSWSVPMGSRRTCLLFQDRKSVV